MVTSRIIRPLTRTAQRTRVTRNHGLAVGASALLPSSSSSKNSRSFSSAQPLKEDAPQPTRSDPALKGAPVIKKEDIQKEEQTRRRLSDVRISEVLAAKHTLRWVDPSIPFTSTVKDAVTKCIDGGLSGMMVVDGNKVKGLTTSRDLLRIIAAGVREGETNDNIMGKKIADFMTPTSQLIYAKPEETIGTCRAIMAKLGIKCLPILSKHGQVEGLITAKDMADYGLEATDKGGKKSFLRDISERVGLGSNTSMAEPPTYLQAHLALEQSPLFVNVAISELPHPFKRPEGCGMNRRDFGPHDHSVDPDLSEDAHFVAHVQLPDEKGDNFRDVTYMGVADGVGSWREYGVDPREFSHRLMEECENILTEAAAKATLGGGKFRRVITPTEILSQAYEKVKAADVVGSSTACVALFDNLRHQLHFSNLGDSGIIVLRHIDSDVAGSLKRDRTPRSERKSDLRVAFVSQQQLKSFNHPFQLGWTGDELEEGESASFKKASDSCTSSIHLRRGDIIIMATDGLFDNVDVEEIASIALDWEQKHGFIRGGDIIARERRWAMGNSLTVISNESLPELAEELALKARENSLDTSLDSPFAILAKENDIMWSGGKFGRWSSVVQGRLRLTYVSHDSSFVFFNATGMPDDCTVVAMHVVGRRHDDLMDKDHQ
jgi:protein phosphatase PTC7